MLNDYQMKRLQNLWLTTLNKTAMSQNYGGGANNNMA